jgi:hypothetical protein
MLSSGYAPARQAKERGEATGTLSLNLTNAIEGHFLFKT